MTHSILPDGITPTPLIPMPLLAEQLDVSTVLLKAENYRKLGNFKSLGGGHAARLAIARLATGTGSGVGQMLICASDGNHGLAVAAAARDAGIASRIYLPTHVSDGRIARISGFGANIIKVRGTYDDAVLEARTAAERGEGILIADTSDALDDIVVADVMAGYATIASEVIAQIRSAELASPTHLFVQAGVGGFAAAMAEGLSHIMAAPGKIIAVEPQAAACVAAALTHGAPVKVDGTLETCADMLSCGVASAPALEVLVRYHADNFQVGEDALLAACATMERSGGPATTPSGAAGLAGLVAICEDMDARRRFAISDQSTVLLFATEGR